MQLLTNLYELKEPAIQLRLQVITDYDLGVLSYYVNRRRLLFGNRAIDVPAVIRKPGKT